jgi:hypothetical protein
MDQRASRRRAVLTRVCQKRTIRGDLAALGVNLRNLLSFTYDDA